MLLAVLACPADSLAADALGLTPRWQVGERVAYAFVRGRAEPEPQAHEAAGRVPLADSTQGSPGAQTQEAAAQVTRVDIEVLATGPDGHLLLWRSSLERGELEGGGLARRLEAAASGVPLRLKLDASGALRGLANAEQARALMRRGVEDMLAGLAAKGATGSAVAVARSQAEGVLGSVEAYAAYATEAPRLLLRFLGQRFVGSGPVSYEGIEASPLGGQPLPVRGQFELEAPPSGGLASLAWRQELDREKAAPVLAGALREMAERTPGEGPDPGALEGLALEETASYLVELASGWPREVTHTRTVRLASAERRETVTILRLP